MQPHRHRICVHEVCHAIIALKMGYGIKRTHMTGPPHNPGQMERSLPQGIDETKPDWSRKLLAVLCAGAVGEEVVFGNHNRDFVENGYPDTEFHVMDQAAIMVLNVKENVDYFNSNVNQANRHETRDICDHFIWSLYDDLNSSGGEILPQPRIRHQTADLNLNRPYPNE